MQVSALIMYIPFMLAGALGFGFLVGFHELGHFLFCKLFGVRTPSFSIGFGPQLLKKKIGDTVFTLSALPFGGYVEIAGSEEPGQGQQAFAKSMAPDSFAVKPYYQKMLIIAGGILFNLVFAYIAVTLAFAWGAPKTPLLFPNNATSTIESVIENSAAAQAGLAAGDSIEGIKTADEVFELTKLSLPVFMHKLMQTLTKQRGKEVTLRINHQKNHEDSGIKEISVLVGDKGLGISFEYLPVKATSTIQALQMGIKQTNFWIFSTVDALTKLFREKSVKGIGGPVMVINQMIKGAEKGFVVFLLFLAFISVNLAVMNLIPLPVFDGGQALFYTIEALIGRPLPDTIRNGIAYGTWILLLLLISWVTIQDILLIAKPYLGL
ncbi:MAG: site-2 protease family protein [Candidatus Babeliaceae bacterium]|nr:site-2 protease family protein [Candidatus Babeliaceae bacterium]